MSNAEWVWKNYEGKIPTPEDAPEDDGWNSHHSVLYQGSERKVKSCDGCPIVKPQDAKVIAELLNFAEQFPPEVRKALGYNQEHQSLVWHSKESPSIICTQASVSRGGL